MSARPFLKWVGGKRKLLPSLLPFVPAEIGTYHEPFLGGGALFWALASAGRFKRAVLSDINVELMRTYSAIKLHPGDVLEALGRHVHTKEHFLAVRALDPFDMTFAECAARMIFLNKTCINGLYRVNQKGRFNASFGSYKTMTRFIDHDVLHACSRALQDVGLYSMRWDDALGSKPPVAAGDFVYLDPPYVPTSATANFTSYAAGGFSQQDQSNLCTWAIGAAKRGIAVMASNSDTPWVRRNYADFDLHEVSRAGTMNSDAEKRAAVPELIMRSKKPDAGTTARGESSFPNARGVDCEAAIPHSENDGKRSESRDRNAAQMVHQYNAERPSTPPAVPMQAGVETSPGEQRAMFGGQR